MKFKDSYHPYAIVTIVFWSLAYVLTRLLLHHFSALSLGFLRYFMASCTLIVVVLFCTIKLPQKADRKWFLATGVVGFFLYTITFNKGCETVTASTSSVIIAIVPVLTAFLARFIYDERLNSLQWTAIVIELLGVIILTLMNGTFTINTGLFWLFLAAIALSIYNLLQHKLVQTYSGLQTSAFSIFAGTIMLAIFLPKSMIEVQSASPVQLFYVSFLGIFSSALAYVTWSQAFAKAKSTSSVSNYMFVTPLLASVFGFIIAEEKPDLPTLVGGAIILSGVLLFNYGGILYACIPHKRRTL